MKYLQLTWSNWSHICDFIDKENFITGVYLDDKTRCALPNIKSSNTIGLYMKINDKIVLVKQDDYIIDDNGKFKIKTELQFIRNEKLKQIYENRR